MKVRFLLIIFIVIGGLVLGGLSTTNPSLQSLIQASKTRADIVEQAQKAVVHIKVEKNVKRRMQHNPFEQWPRFPQQRQREFRQQGQGSGSIINKDGYILTNNHVVGESDKIVVTLNDGREFDASIIGTDPHSDIAVIKIEGDNLPILPTGDSDKIRIGETTIAIGNPFGLSNTVTMGIISAKGRSNIGIVDYENFIQTDAAINPGNSGGPLIDLEGKIIGVNTAIFSGNGGNQGIGFAVPVNMAKRIMNELIEKGKVSRGWLGVSIQNINKDLARALDLKDNKGSLISAVLEGSPAEKAGLQQGDVVIRLNESPIADSTDLMNKVGRAAPGSNALLAVIRKGETLEIEVPLGEKPSNPRAQRFSVPEENPIGVSVQALTPELAKRLGQENLSGVVVSEVEPGSLAASAGLRPGYVIQEVDQTSVKDLESFNQAMKAADLEKGVLLLIGTPNGSRYVIVKSK